MRRLEKMRKGKYRARVKQLNKIGATYLRLSAKGLCMWTEWRLPDGTIVHVDLD